MYDIRNNTFYRIHSLNTCFFECHQHFYFLLCSYSNQHNHLTLLHVGNLKVAADHVLVLNSVTRSLPFPVTTADTVKEKFPEEIRLR